MFNEQYSKPVHGHKDAWTLNYLFPEKYYGAKIPDNNNSPSNTTTIVMERNIRSSSNGYLGVFSPVTETCAVYNSSYAEQLPVGEMSEYVVYADNDTGPLNVTSNIMDSLSSWNFKRYPSYNKLSAYKKLRVVGACLELSIVDKKTDCSGIIETGLYLQVIGNGLKQDNLNITKLSNYLDYKTFSTDKEVILKYRYNNEKYISYGPYDPFSTIPIHIVKVSGLSPSASVKIKTIIHLEGLLMPRLVHFATTSIVAQTSINQQKENIRVVAHTTSDTKIKTDEEHSKYTSKFPPDDRNSIKDDGFPREKTKKPRIRMNIDKKEDDDDLLKKRYTFELEDDFSDDIYANNTDYGQTSYANDIFNGFVNVFVNENINSKGETLSILPDANKMSNKSSKKKKNNLAIQDDPDKMTANILKDKHTGDVLMIQDDPSKMPKENIYKSKSEQMTEDFAGKIYDSDSRNRENIRYVPTIVDRKYTISDLSNIERNKNVLNGGAAINSMASGPMSSEL